MLPRIAIPVPTSHDLEYNRANHAAYVQAVRACGGEPVTLVLGGKAASVAAVIASCDGVVLPGSPADVDPASYGQECEAGTAPRDGGREAMDRLLLEDAFIHCKPILGVCFGAQMLNVFCGGTLIQNLTTVPVNHAAGASVAVAHAVAVAPSSLLSSIADASEAPAQDGSPRLPVNSSHHQAIAIAGRNLNVSARCPQDAVIEAVEMTFAAAGTAPPHFVLGVQWHPERSIDFSATSRALFSRLVAEAEAYRSRRSGTQL